MLIEEVAAMLHGKREFVCLDLETTGVSTRHNRVIEIGAVRFNSSGKLTREFSSLAFPGHGYLHGAEFIHGISQREVESAAPIGAVLHQLMDFVATG
jgi:DNA polymerase-3 subunit epsilon